MKTSHRWALGCLVLVMLLAPLKLGTPVVLQSSIAPPSGWVEWLYFSWPNQLAVMFVFVALIWAAVKLAGCEPVVERASRPFAPQGPGAERARRPFHYFSGSLLNWLPVIWLATQMVALPGSICRQLSIDTVLYFAACVVALFAAARAVRSRTVALAVFAGLGLATIMVLRLALEQHLGGLQQTRELANQMVVSPDLRAKLTSIRVFGPFVYPNALAGYLALAFGPTLACLLWVRLKGGLGVVQWIVVAVIGALVVFCLTLTGSRGGLVAFGAAASVGLVCLTRRWWVVVLVAALAVSAVVFTKGPLNRGVSSAAARGDYWRGAVAIAKDHPWLGTGPGTFGSIYLKYKTAPTEEAQLVHNNFLEMACDSGVVALVVFAALWVAALWEAWRLAWQRSGDVVAAALGAALTGWVVHGVVDFDLYVPGIALPAFVMLGMVQGLREEEGGVKREERGRWWLRVVVAAVVAVVVWVEGRELAAGMEFGRAGELAHRGRMEEAYRCAQRAVELAPLNSRYWALAGEIAGSLGRFEVAARDYQGAVRNDRYRAAYHWHWAQAELAAHGATAVALAELREAVALSPMNQRYREALAAVEESVGQGTGILLRSVPARKP